MQFQTSNFAVSWSIEPWSYTLRYGSTGSQLCTPVIMHGNGAGTVQLTATTDNVPSPIVYSEVITVLKLGVFIDPSFFIHPLPQIVGTASPTP